MLHAHVQVRDMGGSAPPTVRNEAPSEGSDVIGSRMDMQQQISVLKEELLCTRQKLSAAEQKVSLQTEAVMASTDCTGCATPNRSSTQNFHFLRLRTSFMSIRWMQVAKETAAEELGKAAVLREQLVMLKIHLQEVQAASAQQPVAHEVILS